MSVNVKKIKRNIYKWLVPLLFITNTSSVFADDEITRKMNTGKNWAMGVLTIASIINAGFAIVAAGNAKGQAEVEATEKRRKNAFFAVGGIVVLDILVALWQSW